MNIQNDISSEETAIAENINKHINKEEFIRRNIESLDRIINKYFMNKNRDPIEEKEVIEFLFRYLKKEWRN